MTMLGCTSVSVSRMDTMISSRLVYTLISRLDVMIRSYQA